MRLLAQSVAGTSTVEEWHAAQPRDTDALVPRGETEVMRAFNLAVSSGGATVDRYRLDQAVQTCLRAATAVPEDPVPWVWLLTVARLFPGGHPQVEKWWYELQLRDRYNREAHHQACATCRHAGTAPTPRCATSPATSPAAPRPARRWPCRCSSPGWRSTRHRTESGERRTLTTSGQWRSETALADTRRAFGLWIEQWDGVDRAQDIADPHNLLHAACFGGLDVIAAHLFGLVGNRATHAPWSYFGDPAVVLDQWYERIMG